MAGGRLSLRYVWAGTTAPQQSCWGRAHAEHGRLLSFS